MDVFTRKAMMGANTLLSFLMSHTGAVSSSHCLVVESFSKSSTSPVETSSKATKPGSGTGHGWKTGGGAISSTRRRMAIRYRLPTPVSVSGER